MVVGQGQRDSMSPQSGHTQFNNTNILGNPPSSSFTSSSNMVNPNADQYQNILLGAGASAGVGQVKLETFQQHNNRQQFQRNIEQVKMELQHSPVKIEPQHSLLLQQQQFLNRQPPSQAALLHQQRLLQLHHQQNLFKNIPQQHSLAPPAKPVYEPGMCARRLTHYMYQQQHRPQDNSIEFWRKFVAEYFAPNAKKKWCVSLYGSGRHTTGVFPQDVWHCEICNKKPGRGFEANAEVLPRLFKIKYESGTLEELLYVDMPQEYQNLSGQIVLDYAKAIQESVFEQLRVVRDGQLRIVFSADLKICSWEFCARHHEELIPRRLLIPQISQLGSAAQKYQAATNNASSNQSVPELQSNCNMFVASARHLAKALEVPLVNDLGYTKRYVRCLQISEVVNSMKDLIDYSRETSVGPMECLAKFPRRTSTTSGFHSQPQQPDLQQNSNGMSTANNANPIPINGTISGLLHQNSMASKPQQNSINTPQTSLNGALNTSSVSSPNVSMQLPTLSSDADPNDSQSSVQKILHEMMTSGSSGSDMKNVDNLCYKGNGGSGFGAQSGMVNGIRAAMGHNSFSMNARVTVRDHHHQQQQQQNLGSQLLNGLGTAHGFNKLPFDWKASP